MMGRKAGGNLVLTGVKVGLGLVFDEDYHLSADLTLP